MSTAPEPAPLSDEERARETTFRLVLRQEGMVAARLWLLGSVHEAAAPMRCCECDVSLADRPADHAPGKCILCNGSGQVTTERACEMLGLTETKRGQWSHYDLE
jgi:hypothetical protein